MIVFFAKESVASWPTFDVEVRSTLEINTEFAVLSDPEKEYQECLIKAEGILKFFK